MERVDSECNTMEATVARKDVQGFELDKNGFVMLTKSNAKTAQDKVDASAKEADGKKSFKTRKTLSAIREDDLTKNDLCQLIRREFQKGSSGEFLDIVKKINDTNSTRLSKEEQDCFAKYINKNKEEILEKIEKGTLGIVKELADEGRETSKNRYNFSFSSKFCTYISRYAFNENDKFTPYDNVLQKILPYYAWAYCEDKTVENFKDKENKKGYVEYVGLIRKIVASAGKLYGAEGMLTLKEFDRLLWYKYKGLPGEDLIGISNSLLIKEA